ncbi:putative peptidoglycan glycosyltransferase FtsW [soil metagenome]
MNKNSYNIDILILMPVILLMIFSISAVYSASSSFSLEKFADSNYLFRNHSFRVLGGIICIFVFAKMDYKIIQKYSKILIWTAIVMLALVFVLSAGPVKGASRWLHLGPLSFQPSDFAKYALIIYLSSLLAKKKEYIGLLYKGYLPVLFYILLITGLVAIQPNFSVSLIIFTTSMLMLLLTEAKVKHMIFTVLALTPAGILFVLSKGYILERLSSHSEYTSGGNTSYQLQQALIGFGNGGFLGIGPGHSNQRDFFLPESYGDFIFSIIGEEYGFIGTSVIILLFVLLLFRGFKTAKMVEDDFGKYLAFGITTLLTFYAMINMSVATGVIPTTGVPMPFVSYGGTALFFNAIAIGILLNISSQRKRDLKFNALRTA